MKLPTLLSGLTFALTLALTNSGALLANGYSGSFDIGGSSANVTQTGVSFNCDASISTAPCVPGGPGNFAVNAATGDLTPYLGEGGYIKNLSEATTPLNTPFLLSNWLTFFTGPVLVPDLALDLRFINLGIDPQTDCTAAPAVGQLCTPIIPALVGAPNDPQGLSSFNLQNLSNGGSSASFTVTGTARKLSTGELSSFTGTFTASLDTPYQVALQQILSGQPFTHTYGVSFRLTPIPEPGFGLPVLFGCLLAFFARRYRGRRILNS
jgi:hypothetical protein